MRGRAIVGLGITLASSCAGVDLDLLQFACASDEDCARGTVCSAPGICVAPGEAPDSGVEEPARNAGCSPSAEMTTAQTDHWWCRGLTGDELRTFTERFGAKVLDLEIERRGDTFSAALARKSDGYASGWSADIDLAEAEGQFFSKGLVPSDINVISRSRRNVRFAAAFEAEGGAWFRSFEHPRDQLLASQTAALDEKGWRPPGYAGRITDLDRSIGPNGEVWAWVVRVRSPARATAMVFDLSAAEVEARAQSERVTDVEDSDLPGRFSIVTATRAVTDPEVHFVAEVTAEELDAALLERRAHVRRIVTKGSGLEQRWSALIATTTTRAEDRIAARIGHNSAGQVGMALAHASGSTLASMNASATFRAGALSKIPVLLHALERIQAGEASPSDRIPIYPFAEEACPGDRPLGTVSLAEALAGMMQRDEWDRMKGLVVFFGSSAIDDLTRELGAASTRRSGVLGCDDDASVTTHEDTVRILRGAVTRLDAPHQRQLLDLMAGVDVGTSTSERGRWQLEEVLDAMVLEEAQRLEVSRARSAAFRAALDARYVRGSRLVRGTTHDRNVAVIALVPRCAGARIERDTLLYSIGLKEAPQTSDSDRSLGLARAELLREPIRAALATFDCGP